MKRIRRIPTDIPVFGRDARRTAARVGKFWDAISSAWRREWGPHIHHGYYEDGREDPAEAQEKLVSKLMDWAGLQPGESVLDVGCGLGETAIRLASSLPAAVTGITLSRRQVEIARAKAHAAGAANAAFRVDDALSMATVDSGGFSVVWSLESCEQFFDKRLFLHHAHRVLKPRGKLVLATWCSSEDVVEGAAAREYEKLCRGFDLPHMPTLGFYSSAIAKAGFRLLRAEDWSARTAPTWTHGLRKIRQIPWMVLLAKGGLTGLRFAGQLKRMEDGTRSGRVRYGVFLAEKESSG
ncbi:MAG: class I SAM-dependent methyltransferase [Lentisphaerae bacterium]|nr:class I SAM-dependent methyltransferase [Lentisphaerota bacterium]